MPWVSLSLSVYTFPPLEYPEVDIKMGEGKFVCRCVGVCIENGGMERGTHGGRDASFGINDDEAKTLRMDIALLEMAAGRWYIKWGWSMMGGFGRVPSSYRERGRGREVSKWSFYDRKTRIQGLWDEMRSSI